jgi:DNA-binding transcriptional regulator GbsR (MarR family)
VPEATQTRADDVASGQALPEAERIVADAIGRLMVLWGFKRNMGRIWTAMYLSDEPLTAQTLRERLGLSSGAVSMTINELARWGVVQKVWMRGDRRDHYVAEANVWRMVSRVVRERERAEIGVAIEAFEQALRALQGVGSGRAGARARVQRERIGKLLELARFGQTMLDALVQSARLDASWLTRFRLRGSREA